MALGQDVVTKSRQFFSSLVTVANLGASLAVIVTAVFVWMQVVLIHESVEFAADARDRPALVFQPNPAVTMIAGSNGRFLRITLEIRNQGSGNAYSVSFSHVEQMPPLHSQLASKAAALESYPNLAEVFRAPASRGDSVVIGAGLSHTLVIDHAITSTLSRNDPTLLAKRDPP